MVDGLELPTRHTAGRGGKKQRTLWLRQPASLTNQEMPKRAQRLEFVMWRSRQRRAARQLASAACGRDYARAWARA